VHQRWTKFVISAIRADLIPRTSQSEQERSGGLMFNRDVTLAGLIIIVLALVTAVVPPASIGQKLTSTTFAESNRAEMESFDEFLDAHPTVAHDLRRNPSLVGNEDFRLNHPALDEFLKNHPLVEAEIHSHPQAFLARERRFGQVGPHISRYELNTFDHLLALHQQTADELRNNPRLVDDVKFLARHADLQEFFEDHPRVRENLKQHPVVFLEPSGFDNREQPVSYHPHR
jgi:hypothetical protein